MTSLSEVSLPLSVRLALEKIHIETIEDVFLYPSTDLFHRLPLSYPEFLSFLKSLALHLYSSTSSSSSTPPKTKASYQPFYSPSRPFSLSSSSSSSPSFFSPILWSTCSCPTTQQTYTLGVYPNEVTEITGVSGVGKTTLCLQTVIQFLQSHPQATALYICSTPPFPIARLLQLTKKTTPPIDLNRLFIHFISTGDQLWSFLPGLLDTCQRLHIQCLILDDVTSWLRYGHQAPMIFSSTAASSTSTTSSSVSSSSSSSLSSSSSSSYLNLPWELMRWLKLCVHTLVPYCCVVNQMVYKEDHLVPALGSQWTEYIHHRIQLTKLKTARSFPSKSDTLESNEDWMQNETEPPSTSLKARSSIASVQQGYASISVCRNRGPFSSSSFNQALQFPYSIQEKGLVFAISTNINEK